MISQEIRNMFRGKTLQDTTLETISINNPISQYLLKISLTRILFLIKHGLIHLMKHQRKKLLSLNLI
jgi:hypothetical protein